jgi:two-component system LytT family response regulator
MIRFGALIADDEPLARERIQKLLVRHPEIEVLGTAAHGREAIERIRALRPRLLFLDVQMPELDGFAVLAALPKKLTPEVVFVTAYDEFAIRAFDVHAVDYLLKPFTRARFTRAVDRCLLRLQHGDDGERERMLSLLESLRAPAQAGGRLAIRDDSNIRFLRFSEIAWLEGAGNYVKLHTKAREHLVRDSLKNLEERLDPTSFLRVHRSAIVNLDAIERLEPWFHGEFIVVLRDGTKVHSSRTYSERLRALVR